jgi:hypothetical protein
MPQTRQEALPRFGSTSRLLTQTIQAGSPGSTAVTFRLAAGAQDANVFIALMPSDDKPRKPRPACTESQSNPREGLERVVSTPIIKPCRDWIGIHGASKSTRDRTTHKRFPPVDTREIGN